MTSDGFFPLALLPEHMREPAAGLVMRPLEGSDLDKGFVALLGQLTQAPPLSRERWIEVSAKMQDSKCYYTVVVEDTGANKIVATATLFAEVPAA